MNRRSDDAIWYFTYGSNLRLQCLDGALDAEAYVVPKSTIYRAPSEQYLGHIIKGLRSFGYPESVIEEVRATAAREPLGSGVDPGRQDFRQ